MKKLCSLLLIIMLMLASSIDAKAYDEPELERVNYFDLSLLVYDYDKENTAFTDQPITLKPNGTFTLVVSKTFLGDLWFSLGDFEIEVEELNGSYYHVDFFEKDEGNQRAFLTFSTNEGFIHLYGIPVKDQHNYEMMIYEGLYADFPGFVPFHEPGEQLMYFGVLPLDFDSQPSLEVIKSYVVAKNPFGDVIPSTLVYDEYSISDKKPGSYQMVFETLYHQIKKRYYLDIRIFDMVAPSLSIESLLSIPLKDMWSLDEIKQRVTISDNVDFMSYQDLVVVSDTYSTAMTLGTYKVVLEAMDSSGNKSVIEVNIELIDVIGPEIKGPSSIYLYATDAPLTNLEIQQKLKVTDDVDGTNVTIQMVANTYLQKTIPGVYQVSFEAKDQTLNATRFDMLIHVIENRGPVFEQSDLILSKTTADQMTEAEVINWLRDQLLLSGLHATDIVVLYNEYEEHHKESGSYYVYLSYQVDGVQMTSRVRIDVKEEPFPIHYVLIPATGLSLVGLGVLVWFKRKKI